MGLISAGDEHNRRGDEALAGLENVQKVVEDVLINDTNLEAHVGRVREGDPPMLGTRNHPPSGQVRLWEALSQLLQVQAVSGWLSGRRPPRQGAPLVPGPHQPHRRPVVLRPGPAIPGLLVEPDSHARPYSVVAVAKVSIRLGDPTPGGFPTSDPGTHQPKDPGQPQAGTPFAAGDRRSPIQGSWHGPLAAAALRRVADPPMRALATSPQAESRYSATEVDLLAVVWAVHKAHLYLAGTDFELVVDHQPLIPILNSKSLDELPSPRLVRLKEKLALYQLTAVWRPGIEHRIVDCFSRYPVDDPDVDDEQADVEKTAHIHAMLFQSQRDSHHRRSDSGTS